MEHPDICITIPLELTADFLGTITLDILHDAKGCGYLAGHKLSQITDLLCGAIFESNLPFDEGERIATRIFVFKSVLAFFLKLWSSRLDALNLATHPDLNSNSPCYWETLRNTVLLPVRNVAGRETEDAFVCSSSMGVEPQNYSHQKEALNKSAQLLAFMSPLGIRKPSDYFAQASGLVNLIIGKMGAGKVVLDMKASAGLIRTITDPIGYIIGLPTYADPGYNMPGMSAIRQNSIVDFQQPKASNHSHYTQTPHEFRYTIKLETPLFPDPLIFFSVRYFYGIATDGIDRENLCVSILDTVFTKTLPHSAEMAQALGNYLNPKESIVIIPAKQIFEKLQTMIWDIYSNATIVPDILLEINTIYGSLNAGTSLRETNIKKVFNENHITDQNNSLFEWVSEHDSNLRVCYLLETLKYLFYFGQQRKRTASCFLPEQMITCTLPSMLTSYLERGDVGKLAFCFHQVYLIREFARDDPQLWKLFDQKLPGRRGNLSSQLDKAVKEWQESVNARIAGETTQINNYLSLLLAVCKEHLWLFVHCDELAEDDPRLGSFLAKIPLFAPVGELKSALEEYFLFYKPEMLAETLKNRDGLLLYALLSCIPQNCDELCGNILPLLNQNETLGMVLGKFSGDFGQILWSMCYGHLFASEDNNASAMALLLCRVPTKYIEAKEHFEWGNIHGLGNGGSVDIVLSKN